MVIQYVTQNVTDMHATRPTNIPQQATNGMSNGTQFQPIRSSVWEKGAEKSSAVFTLLFRESF